MAIPAAFADFWAQAVAQVPRLRSEDFYEAFCFGDSDALADELADLVLRGEKTATASLVWAFEAEGKPLPRPGHLSIVRNGAGQPLCLIETVGVEVLPFDQVGADFAREEGEDDRTLESWRRNHQAFFGRECERLGRQARSDMPVACERFRLVYAAPMPHPKPRDTMATKKSSEHPALKAIRDEGHAKVKVAVSDIDGILRGKFLHKDKFFGAAQPHPEGGFGFCDVVFGWDAHDQCYDNTQVTGWHHGFPDALARLDLDTARRVPWDGGVPFFLGEFVDPDGSPYPICPRQTLKRVLKRAESLGLQPMAGVEFEWFNFAETPQSWAAKRGVGPEPITPGMFGYSLLRMGDQRGFFNALMDDMLAFGVPIEGLHTETGPGVYEAAIAFSGALEAADRAILFKTGAREIGKRFGVMPSFMAKWSAQYPGCSGHVHQSLSDGKTNLFYDAKSPRRMSRLFESYLAGQIAVAMDFAPMFWPTINSYKRLVDGFWAPVKPTWGLDNRTASFRVIAGSPKSTRLETRCPGADINPYLAMAAVIAAGLHGVEKGLKLTAPPITGTNQGAEHVPRAPRSLIETTKIFRESAVARDWLGDTFVEHFAATREWEWRQWQDGVTDWELKRYFEII